MSEYEFVQVDQDGPITLITINRPDVYNALHSPAHIEFDQVFKEFESDPDQWVATGQRTTDEMSHAWIAVTHLDEEGYERMATEREGKPIAMAGDQR